MLRVLTSRRRSDLTDWTSGVATAASAWQVIAGAAALLALLAAIEAFGQGGARLVVVAVLAIAAGLAALAAGAGIVIRSSPAMEAAPSEQRELNFVLGAARSLGSTLDRDEILRRAVALTARGPGATGATDWSWVGYQALEAGNVVTDAAVSYPLDQNQAARAALRTGRAAIVRGDHLRGRVREWYDSLALRVLVMAPVRSGEVTVGLLAAGRRDSVAVDRVSLRLLEVTAELAGFAIGNAEHLARERDHAERMQALEKAKGDLLNLVSHELRGPLTVTRGYFSMLEDGSLGHLPDEAVGLLKIVGGKVGEMESLVEQILEASRLEEERLVVRRVRCDLREAVGEAAASVAHLTVPGHDVQIQVPPSPVTVEGDPPRLTMIVLNLLSNAVKYSPAGGRVSCRLDTTGDRATLEVSDEGIGIAPEQLASLFSRFGRVVTPETSNIPGTGLGLYLARELARLHGGDVTVRSEPGRGSAFTLTLPLASQRGAAGPAGTRASPPTRA